MEPKYYLIINGRQTGPVGYNDLVSAGLTPETPVWRTGLENWVKASSLPELTPLFSPATPFPQQNIPYNAPGLPVAHTNWLPWAIVATVLGVLCCFIGMIFGIIGIINASKANRFYNEGNAYLGNQANSTARTNTIISLVLGVVGIPTSIYVLSENFASLLANLS